mmetsp:Transcript_53208/g.127248  ORF Transcript_53208/g.127248 Transcript_53208/m.127248 type:complete len:110 (+) Transcript_53208:366-695(+)
MAEFARCTFTTSAPPSMKTTGGLAFVGMSSGSKGKVVVVLQSTWSCHGHTRAQAFAHPLRQDIGHVIMQHLSHFKRTQCGWLVIHIGTMLCYSFLLNKPLKLGLQISLQ